ncbi:MAG: hypothetical protein NC310_00650 [Roseburia sp.]|nr:hypothetical protein [Anaeroplasma bactoclasticum]MCM1195561.1 hypothetical protein [Roseburia sp.]MCM1555976.1 hypothetical protein [Anaeroplasma bactoclasticum]
MKKMYIVIYCLETILILIFSIVIASFKKDAFSGAIHTNSTSSYEDYNFFSNYKELGHIQSGMIEVSYNDICSIEITQKEIFVENPDEFLIEKVYHEGSVIGTYIANFDFKVIEIKKESIIVEDLSSTRVLFCQNIKEGNIELPTFVQITSLKSILKIKKVDRCLNWKTKQIEYLISIENQGDLINGLECKIAITHQIEVGNYLYIPKKYVYFIENKYYVYKVYHMNTQMYYKPIEVQLLQSFDAYYRILSVELDEQNLVVLL